MYAVVSPAKKMKAQTLQVETVTPPVFPIQTTELVQVMQEKSMNDIQSLMKVSEKLATLNVERFSTFQMGLATSKDQVNLKPVGNPAVGLFAGDTYKGLDAQTLSTEDLMFAQDHLGILSGLYGLLSPLDAIHPYRLEMGTKLATEKGKNLYQFWGNQVTDALAAKFCKGSKYLINLASNEYFSVLNAQRLKEEFGITVLTPVFKEIDKKNGTGKMKIISFNAKRARGMMARYIIQHRLNAPEGLQNFTEGGYTFRKDLSSDSEWLFVR